MIEPAMVIEIGIVTFIIFASVLGWSYFDSKKVEKMLNNKDV